MKRPLLISAGVHLLLLLFSSVVLRPRFEIPKPLDAIPISFIALAAPEPALTRREKPEPPVLPEVVPDPLKPKPPPRKEPEKKPEPKPEKKPAEKPRRQPDRPKVGSADTTRVVRSELPKVGELRGAMELRVEGEIHPYAYYLAVIRNKIASFWEPPSGLDPTGGEVAAVVWFRIERDGSVRAFHVEEPSGRGFFDTSALRALERALPLPPLPEEYPGEYLIIHLRFVYSR